MYPHPIHLRQPWGTTNTETGCHLTRPFNQPTGIAPTEAVWLCVEQPSQLTQVVLNDMLLGSVAAQETGEFEITTHIAPRNHLNLEFESAEETPTFAGVRLEIRLKSS